MVVGGYSRYTLGLLESRSADDDRAKAAFAAGIIKSGLATTAAGEGHGGLGEFINALSTEEPLSVRLLRPDGTLILSSEGSEGPAKGFPLKSLAVPLRNEKTCQGCHGDENRVLGTLSVTVLRDRPLKSIWTLREKASLNTLLVVASLSACLVLVMVLLVTGPLKRIGATLGRVEAGDFTARFDERRKDEFGLLGRRLNALILKITDKQREMEAGRDETMQKVERMATIGELASAIAHEIKNPLAGISGAIQVLAEDFPSGDPRKEIIVEVLSEIGRLDKTVRDLLSFARPPEPHFIRTPVDGVVERALRLIKGHAKKLYVDVNIVSDEEPVDVRIDPEQMQQVFLNIMMNALHSMPGGGTLTVAIRARKGEGRVEVSVSDTGQGIPDVEAEKIFKPFYTTKNTGTGLGLAVSKNIVEKHNGEITVESELGRGACFRVILPLEEKNA